MTRSSVRSPLSPCSIPLLGSADLGFGSNCLQITGEIVSAYSSEYAGARAASLQDVVTAAFAGNSLVVSAATCRMVASALAAKSAVLPAAANNHALYWSSESQKFVSVYADVADKLAFSFADVEAFAASLGSYDAATKRLSVEGVEFDLSTKVPSTNNVLRF